MAREKIGDDVMPVRFPDGTFDRIMKINPNRTEFIRKAVADALAAVERGNMQKPHSAEPEVEKPISKKPPQPKKNFDGKPVDKDELRPDARVLLGQVRQKRWTSKQHEKALGWPGLRFPRAEGDLFQAKLIKVEDGILVAAGE
ncbi:hypothetical protein [Ruegeria lacuscaerulensis]|uniref:hypothetical protein n=1 Tax=Ruegeria lacuscaerulensis TaxID=55218 RepID=UPI00147ED2C6|nr:hypothetical protein [Ruegeria lacuscaerulensis]